MAYTLEASINGRQAARILLSRLQLLLIVFLAPHSIRNYEIILSQFHRQGIRLPDSFLPVSAFLDQVAFSFRRGDRLYGHAIRMALSRDFGIFILVVFRGCNYSKTAGICKSYSVGEKLIVGVIGK